MVRKARCRSTCEHASKRVDFCRSRCCFADAMDAKFVQNRRKSSMATCNLSTVVPAARRANSKCITLIIKTKNRRPARHASQPASQPESPPKFNSRRTFAARASRHLFFENFQKWSLFWFVLFRFVDRDMNVFGNFCTTHVGASFWDAEKKNKTRKCVSFT